MGVILYRGCKPRFKLTTVSYEDLVAVTDILLAFIEDYAVGQFIL